VPVVGDDGDDLLAHFQSVPFANEYMFPAHHDDLTFEEEETLRHYALTGYSYINAYLRGEPVTTEPALPADYESESLPSVHEIESEIASIRSALQKSRLKEDVRVSREIDGSSIDVADDKSAAASVGRVYDEPGFMSTCMTMHPPRLHSPDDFQLTLELIVPAGTCARALGDLSHFSDQEKELLIMDGRAIQIDLARYDETAGRWRLFGRIE
jgi:hypothetical protein